MAGEYTARLLWDLAVFLGWVSTVPIFISRHSIRKLKALRQALLTSGTDAKVRFWQRDFRYWHAVGLAAIGLSFVCLFSSLLARIPQSEVGP
jgi:hypothetical protein